VFDEAGLTQILDVLYEAPVDPSRWQDFLRLTALSVKGEAGALLLHDFASSQSFVARQWNIDPEAYRLYEALGRLHGKPSNFSLFKCPEVVPSSGSDNATQMDHSRMSQLANARSDRLITI
jgi:hypothetical protein